MAWVATCHPERCAAMIVALSCSSVSCRYPRLPGSPMKSQHIAAVRCRSVVLGKAEVEAAVARVEPARCHHFAAGEEANALHPVRVCVAEEGGLPATERVARHRHRDWHVDSDHADLNLVLVSPGSTAVVGEYGCSIAIRVAVDQVQGLVVRLNPQH